MTIDEYLGHMCDRLMLQFSNRSEMPEMYDWVVMEVILAAVEDLKQDYVLTHKSHIEVSQYESLPLYGFMIRAMMHVQAGDIVPMIEIVQSKNGEGHVLKQHRDHVVSKLLKYLEEPKPEQTQPAQS